MPDTIRGSVEVPGETRSRVELGPDAVDMLRHLWAVHGPLMMHQSGGCCDGSSPMCYPDGELITSEADILLGRLDLGEGRVMPFWMSREQFAYWQHTVLRVETVPGRGSGFSLEAPEGVRFLIRSRLVEEN